MKVSHFPNIFVACGLVSALGITACGQLLELDTYTKANPSSGGSGGMGGNGGGGNGGEAGQGGSNNECMPNTSVSCYEGPANTDTVSPCKSGLKTCSAEGKYGPCEGQVLPALENCALADDEDCNGASAGCTGIANWSNAYGSSASLQFGSHIRGMSDGSIVVVGEFSDAVNFGCAMVNGVAGTTNIFLLKLDSEGQCLFAKQFGTTSLSDYAYGLALDADDNIILTGGYTAIGIDFGGGAFTHAGANDIYLAKFDKDGNHIWSKRYGDGGDQLAYSVNVDAQGNIYLTGDFTGTIDFGNGMIVSAMAKEKKGFLAKLNSTGQPIYVDSFGVTVNVTEGVLETRAAVDASGNAVVIGRFAGTLTTSGAGMVTSKPGGYDIFVLRYDGMGKPVSVRRLGGDGDDYNYYIGAERGGNMFIAGRSSGTNVDLSEFAQPDLPISGMGDVFLMKLLPNGQSDKVKIFGDAAEQTATGLAIDALGHVILGGNFKGQIDFGKDPLGTAMNATLFIAKFDNDLNLLWNRALFSNVAETLLRVGTDPKANILLTGAFSGGLQIEQAMPLPNAGNMDIFVAKLAP